MTLPPAVTVHGLAHARAALAPRRPVTLLSAPGAALFAGVGWWRALVALAGTPWPDVLDCADAPGRAVEALGEGCRLLVLDPACPAHADVAGRAAALGGRVLPARPPALDLARRGAARDLPAWLARDSAAPFG